MTTVLISVLCGDLEPASETLRAQVVPMAEERASITGQTVASITYHGTEDGASGLRSVWLVELA